MHQSIKSRLEAVQANIDRSIPNKEQSLQGIKLIAVSKLQSIEVIQEAYDCGLKNFGENYAQELSEKARSFQQDIVWHFIGPIQTNKLKLAAGNRDTTSMLVSR